MAVGEIAGVSIGASGPVSGAAVSLYLASRIAGQPAQGAAAPGGAADYGPISSGTSFGAVGAFTFTGVTEGDYYVLAVISGTNYWAGPFSVVENSDVAHLTGTETVTGAKTFSGGVTFSGTVAMTAGTLSVAALTGVLPLTNGGTGSATKNFVDLSTAQSVAGVKTFTAQPVLSAGLNVSAGSVIFPAASIDPASINGLGSGFTGAALGVSQTFTGQETFAGDVLLKGSQAIGTALASAAAPTVTATGTPGTTTYQYEIVATAYDGRDCVPGPAGSTTTGNATLTGSNYNALSWAAVPNAYSYKVLRWNGSVYQVLAGGILGTTYSDNGSATPASFGAATRNPGGEVNGSDVLVSGASLPRGTLGYAQSLANQTVTTTVDVTGATVTVTVAAGRRIRVSAYLLMSNNTAGGGCYCYILADGVQAQENIPVVGGANTFIGVNMSAILTPAAGSHTYKLQAGSGGVGTATVNGNGGYPVYILVEDIGT